METLLLLEDLEPTTIENPYYGDSIQMYGQNGNNPGNNNTERIFSTDNVYYDMDDMEFSGPRTTVVTSTQNVYYE